MHQQALAANDSNKEIPDEENCVKNWKLYDDVFHYVFYNISTKKLYIKKKTDVDSPTQKNILQNAMQNELIKVVNGFIPSRMKELIDDFKGENQQSLEKCGFLIGNSLIACYTIFGDRNCDRITNTFYYSRKCPKGYIREDMSCAFDCTEFEMRNDKEYCMKDEDN